MSEPEAKPARTGPLRLLTVAGTDSGGGAGVIADVKTFDAHRAWSMVAVTAVTAQNTLGVRATQPVDPDVVVAQIEAVVSDIGVHAAKTGMLPSPDTVEAVADAVKRLEIAPVVVDPVLASGHGDALCAPETVEALRACLLPHAALVTPNLDEAGALAGHEPISDEAGMEAAAHAILELGPTAVLVTGGHLGGDSVVDCLAVDGATEWFRSRRVEVPHTHGTGCVLSAALAARLGRGEPLVEAVAGARMFVASAIEHGLALGAGTGPVNPRR